MDITITYNGLEIGSMKNIKVIKEMPEKQIKLVKISGKNVWLKNGSTSVEFSKLNLTPWSKNWGILKSSAFFVTARSQIEESTINSDREGKLLSDAEDNFNRGIHILNQMDLEIPENKTDFETYVQFVMEK